MQVLGAAASGVASFAIDAQGCVWSWGTSKRGQLGQGAGIAEAERPARLPGLEGITSLACGWGHALALRGLHLPKMLAVQNSGSQKLHGRACYGSVGHSFAVYAGSWARAICSKPLLREHGPSMLSLLSM